MPLSPPTVTVQVIIPARNEEDCIGRCLDSLVRQTGISYQITLVDDGSTDRTRAIAESFPGVRVISAGEPQHGLSGKCNALITFTFSANSGAMDNAESTLLAIGPNANTVISANSDWCITLKEPVV